MLDRHERPLAQQERQAHMLVTTFLLFNWLWGKDDGKNWESQQEVEAIDGLVQDDEQFTEMDELGLIPETPWGDTDGEHEAVDPDPPEDNGPPRWMKWLGL